MILNMTFEVTWAKKIKTTSNIRHSAAQHTFCQIVNMNQNKQVFFSDESNWYLVTENRYIDREWFNVSTNTV